MNKKVVDEIIYRLNLVEDAIRGRFGHYADRSYHDGQKSALINLLNFYGIAPEFDGRRWSRGRDIH